MSAQAHAAIVIALARLFTVGVGGVSTFSFSSSSLGAELSLIFLPEADTFSLACCSSAVLDALRCILGVLGVGVALDDDDRTCEEGKRGRVGVGVPIDARPIFGGGGPMDPVAILELEAAVPFARTLLPRALGIGVSSPR